MASASLAHHYDDPKDALIEPHKFMALTHYYVDRWLPDLGERGHIIVTVLRRMGYLDRKRDVERGGIEIEQEELAALCGLKLRTFQREFAVGENGQPVNPALHKFVQREQQYHRNGAGRVVREKTVYVIQMRDPLHPSDQAAFEEECEAREKNVENFRSRHIGGNKSSRSRQYGGDSRQDDACSRQYGGADRHIGGNNKVILDSYILEETLGTPAAVPELSASLFEEPDEEPEKKEPEPTAWADLTPEQQQPFRVQAKHELLPYAIQAGEKAWDRMGPRQEEVRARNLYEAEETGKKGR